MTTGPFFDPERREEDKDPVWRLLARSPLPRPDAWFSVRTLARCRAAGVAGQIRHTRLLWLWRWLAGAGVAACLAISLGVQTAPVAGIPAPAGQQNVQEAFDILATMQPETDLSSSSSWQDSDL